MTNCAKCAPPLAAWVACRYHAAVPGERASGGVRDQEVEINALAHTLVDGDRIDGFSRRNGKAFAGTHLIIEVVDGDRLDCQATVETALRRCVEASGATLLHIHLHKFSPQGVSGVAVLAESHISVHTWPEVGYGAFDAFMCGDADPWACVEILREAFAAGDVRVSELLRGEGVIP